MTFDAQKATRLIAEAVDDDERMTPTPWDTGEDEREAAATLRAAPVISGQSTPCGPPFDVIMPFGRAYSDARGIARTRNNLAAMASQLRSAVERVAELERERDEWHKSYLLIVEKHDVAVRERDEARAEVERMRVLADAARRHFSAIDDLAVIAKHGGSGLKLCVEVERSSNEMRAALDALFSALQGAKEGE